MHFRCRLQTETPPVGYQTETPPVGAGIAASIAGRTSRVDAAVHSERSWLPRRMITATVSRTLFQTKLFWLDQILHRVILQASLASLVNWSKTERKKQTVG